MTLLLILRSGSCALKFRKKGSTTVLFTLAASDVGDNFADGVAIFAFLRHSACDCRRDITKAKYPSPIAAARSETVFKVLDFLS